MDGNAVNRDLAALSLPEMEILSSILGQMIVSLPFILVVLAWRSARRKGAAQLPWRKRMFAVALIGAALGYVWFWLVFLFIVRVVPLELYWVIGWASESFALIFLALSFAGTGATRIFALLASAGIAVLWVSVGFWRAASGGSGFRSGLRAADHMVSCVRLCGSTNFGD